MHGARREEMTKNIAWAAGLFEGEGCIGTHKRKRVRSDDYLSSSLDLTMTCHDVVERFHDVVGCGSVRRRASRKREWKPSFSWYVHAARDVERVLGLCLPFLGRKKTREAERAFTICAGVGIRLPERTHCPYGHGYTEENTGYTTSRGVRQRRCIACRRERDLATANSGS